MAVKRRAASKASLVGTNKWCTERFWEEVVYRLSAAGSTTFCDGLKDFQRLNMDLVDVLQRGTREMYRRLKGEGGIRAGKERCITAGDLRLAHEVYKAGEPLAMMNVKFPISSSLIANTSINRLGW